MAGRTEIASWVCQGTRTPHDRSSGNAEREESGSNEWQRLWPEIFKAGEHHLLAVPAEGALRLESAPMLPRVLGFYY